MGSYHWAHALIIKKYAFMIVFQTFKILNTHAHLLSRNLVYLASYIAISHVDFFDLNQNKFQRNTVFLFCFVLDP